MIVFTGVTSICDPRNACCNKDASCQSTHELTAVSEEKLNQIMFVVWINSELERFSECFVDFLWNTVQLWSHVLDGEQLYVVNLTRSGFITNCGAMLLTPIQFILANEYCMTVQVTVVPEQGKFDWERQLLSVQGFQGIHIYKSYLLI